MTPETCQPANNSRTDAADKGNVALDAKALEAAVETWVATDNKHRFFGPNEDACLLAAIAAYLSALLPADVAELVEKLNGAARGLCTEDPHAYTARGLSAGDALAAATTISALSARLERAEEVIEPEERLPTRDEARQAAKTLLTCNGADLDSWGAGDLIDDVSQDALKALAWKEK